MMVKSDLKAIKLFLFLLLRNEVILLSVYVGVFVFIKCFATALCKTVFRSVDTSNNVIICVAIKIIAQSTALPERYTCILFEYKYVTW